MADISPKERLQPALLDRLTDNDPDQSIEARDRRVISYPRLREYIRRDLAWLMNCGRLESLIDLDEFPAVKHSVLNYGIPDLSGLAVAGAEPEIIARIIREAIVRYEPRVLESTLEVVAETDPSQMNRNSLQFRIRCEMWAQPLPQSMYLHTAIDIETGDVVMTEGGR